MIKHYFAPLLEHEEVLSDTHLEYGTRACKEVAIVPSIMSRLIERINKNMRASKISTNVFFYWFPWNRTHVPLQMKPMVHLVLSLDMTNQKINLQVFEARFIDMIEINISYKLFNSDYVHVI